MNLHALFDLGVADYTRTLLIRGLYLRVAADSVESISLLEDTFYPQGMFDVEFQDNRAEKSRLTILDRVITPVELEDLQRQMRANFQRSTFELTRSVFCARYDKNETTLFVLGDEEHQPPLVLKEGRNLTIVGVPSISRKRWLTRLVRDIATRIAKSEGSLVLHASGFQYREKAYLAVGDSGAGKSTLGIVLPSLLDAAAWIGNDRIHLDAVSGGYRVTSCPLPLAVNKQSMDLLGMTDYLHWDLQAPVPSPESDWDEFMGESKIRLSSAEVERWLGVSITAAAPLGGVIFPQVRLECSYQFSTIARADAEPILRRNCFSLYDNLFGEDWLAIGKQAPTGTESFSQFMRDIDNVPLFRCSLGNREHLNQLSVDLQKALKE